MFYSNPNATRPTLVEIHTADIHFGAMDPKVQYDLLTKGILDKLQNIQFDLFCINGDLFHHKFMSNSDAVLYASMFVDNIVQLCKRNRAALILLHGTASHDANQLKLFYHYLADTTLEMYIIETASFVTTHGKKILCLPEEYNKGRDYYLNLLEWSGSYDSVCMHGNLKGAIFGCDKEDLDTAKNPTFDISSFQFCRGPIIAGHVHVSGCYQSHMYYSGSPLRWQFGEEETKGFLIVIHDLDSSYYAVQMEEVVSFKYNTINLDEMVNYDPKDVIKYLTDLKATGVDYIKVKFTKGSPTVDALKVYYKMNNEVTIDASDVQFQETIRENQKVSEEYAKYSYISDKNLTPNDIIVRYINDEKGCEFITVDELVKLLSSID
jgi:DNA repair exonuclease SbcCD nuclease subunit